jgi:sirohydrochlorin cobaltochelatase
MKDGLDALILFSHGSLLCGAGNTLYEHAARLSTEAEFDIVEVGYLNYSQPDFIVTVKKCVNAGVSRIVVLPYFLVPGKFVGEDLPRRIADARSQYPDIEFVVAEPIGYDIRLADAILELAGAASGAEGWRETLQRAPEFCISNPRCPLFETRACPKTYAQRQTEATA